MAENELQRDQSRGWPADGREFALHSVVVERKSGPTRCTVYPRHLARDERTTTWLSADQSAFYDLATMR